MQITPLRSPRALLTIGVVAAAGLLAACGSTATKTSSGPATTGMNMGGPSMPGMDMSETIPGKGLLPTASGLTLRPSTTSVPAGQTSVYRFQIVQADGTPVTNYQVEQTKLLHFYLVRDDLTGFEHLHPTLAADGTWNVNINPADGGSYRVFTQFIGRPANKTVGLVLSQPLTVTGPASPAAPLPAPKTATEVDGYTLNIAGKPKANSPTALTVTVTHNGSPVTDLQPYLDTYAHLTAFHQGDLGFAHLHPSGTVNGDHGGPTLHFDAVLTDTGNYRLFLQFQTGGNLHSAQITLPVG